MKTLDAKATGVGYSSTPYYSGVAMNAACCPTQSQHAYIVRPSSSHCPLLCKRDPLFPSPFNSPASTQASKKLHKTLHKKRSYKKNKKKNCQKSSKKSNLRKQSRKQANTIRDKEATWGARHVRTSSRLARSQRGTIKQINKWELLRRETRRTTTASDKARVNRGCPCGACPLQVIGC